MKSKGILDIFKEIFSWVGMIVGAIASVATLAAGIATGNFTIAGGAVALTMSVNSIVSKATDGKVSISAGISAGLKACGVSENVANYVGMGFELAITAVGIGLTLGAGAASSAATASTGWKVGNAALKGMNIASGVAQMGSGATGIAGAEYDYKIANSFADTKELEAILERIQQAQDMEFDFLKGIMERAEKMVEDVNNIVEDCNQSQNGHSDERGAEHGLEGRIVALYGQKRR